MNRKVDVVIPTCRPTAEFHEVLQRLLHQTVPPQQILLINTDREFFDMHLLDSLEGRDRIRIIHIRRQEFDHGGTRRMGAAMVHSELLLLMTQDALPENEHLIENLADAFEEEQVGAAYARQIARPDCTVLERFTRSFNYPQESHVRSAADLPVCGVKTFFCSNVCAMYRRSAYEEAGGFEQRTIFNEDMILAWKMICCGKTIAYCADALVIHSHNYTGREQFCRNFDLGVSQAEHPEIFSGVRSEEEGTALVRKTAQYLCESRQKRLLFSLVWISGCKYLGYRLGKSYQRLPGRLVRLFSQNKNYWETGS